MLKEPKGAIPWAQLYAWLREIPKLLFSFILELDPSGSLRETKSAILPICRCTSSRPVPTAYSAVSRLRSSCASILEISRSQVGRREIPKL
jgi:hypothetical protein